MKQKTDSFRYPGRVGWTFKADPEGGAVVTDPLGGALGVQRRSIPRGPRTAKAGRRSVAGPPRGRLRPILPSELRQPPPGMEEQLTGATGPEYGRGDAGDHLPARRLHPADGGR